MEDSYFRKYYMAHREHHAELVRRYREDDPTGEKARARKISQYRSDYKRYRTLKRAVSWYAFANSLDRSEVEKRVMSDKGFFDEVMRWVKERV